MIRQYQKDLDTGQAQEASMLEELAQLDKVMEDNLLCLLWFDSMMELDLFSKMVEA